MRVCRDIETLRRFLAESRRGRRVVLVPTMGALHAGHGACVSVARGLENALVVCSVFVNPTQFGPGEDFEAYPRSLESDAALLERWGCDLLFAPSARVVYPETQTVWVEPGPLAEPLCGRFRPGHFRGVATVVAKLFGMAGPDDAVFGQKDAQQALVIRALTRQLGIPVVLHLSRTVREPDGLAMSSRNAYLSTRDRARAARIHAALVCVREALEAGERESRALEGLAMKTLHAGGIERVDYAEVRRADDLSALEHIEGRVILAIAAWVGNTRLIDNMVFDVDAHAVGSDVPLF